MTNCSKQIVLALESATRYIAQCEHHTIHIVWDNLTIHLRPVDFAAFADIIENAYVTMKNQAKPNRFHLAVKDVGLSFSPSDLAVLHQLTWLAEMGLDDTGKAKSIPAGDPPSETLAVSADLPSFSLN